MLINTVGSLSFLYYNNRAYGSKPKLFHGTLCVKTTFRMTICCVAAFLLLIATTACDKNPPEPTSGSRRVVLVYAAAYNSLSNNLAADLEEMERGLQAAGKDGRVCRWLVYRTNYTAENPVLTELKIVDGKARWETLKNYSKEVMSSSPERLAEVIADVKSVAPADDYGLVLWSHASGWTPARSDAGKYWFGDDTSQGTDSPLRHMDITDMANAIPPGMFSFIWADCCHMGGVEVAYELKGRCDKYVAYATEVLAEGMPYDIVIPFLLGPRADLEGGAKAFFDYWNSCNGQYRSASVAVINQNNLDDLATACRALMQGKPVPDAAGIQYYHRRATGLGPYYDLRGVALAYAGADTAAPLYANIQQALKNTVSYAACTERFLELALDADKYCGLSTNLFNPDSNTPSNYFYTTLKWYNAVYNPQ